MRIAEKSVLGAHESWTCDSCPICIYTWRTYVCLCVHTLCVASVDFAFPWDWLRSCGQPQSKVSSQMLGDCIRTLDAQIFSLISLMFCCFWLCGWRGTLRSVLDSAFQLQAKGERLKRPALARTTFPPLSLTPPLQWFLEMLALVLASGDAAVARASVVAQHWRGGTTFASSWEQLQPQWSCSIGGAE